MHETEICIKTPTLVSILSFDASSNSNRIEFQREKTTKGFLRDFFYPVIRRIVISGDYICYLQYLIQCLALVGCH